MGRQENTKELFIVEALKLFSERGYDAVKLSEIAKAVGCTAPALYKHFKNKQELYDAILEASKQGYSHMSEPVDPDMFAAFSEAEIVKWAQQIFLIPVNNEMASSFRKLMIIEQFSKAELAAMYDERYIKTQIERMAVLFEEMIKRGIYKDVNPRFLASILVNDIVLLVEICDRDCTKKEWALGVIEENVKEFYRVFHV